MSTAMVVQGGGVVWLFGVTVRLCGFLFFVGYK